MQMRLIALCLMAAGAAAGQTYSGPVPPKADIPYLKHAENLVATEALDAKEEKSKKGDITYVIAGAASSARTPLAAPIFLMRIDKLVASRLALYKLEVRAARDRLRAQEAAQGNRARRHTPQRRQDGADRSAGEPGTRRVLAESRGLQPGFLLPGVLGALGRGKRPWPPDFHKAFHPASR